MVRERVMRFGDANLRIRASTGFAGQLKRDNARDIALQRQNLKVEHQLGVVRVCAGHADGAIQVRQMRIGRLALRFLDAALHFAHAVEVAGDLRPVARPQFSLEPRDIFAYPIQKAGVLLHFGQTFRIAAAVTKKPLKHNARMSLSGQRRGGRRPREIVLVHAGKTVVAIADRR